jgi:hypothetical protein
MCLFQAERLEGTSNKLKMKNETSNINSNSKDLIKSEITYNSIEGSTGSIEGSTGSIDASPNPLEVITETETDINDQEQLDQDDLHDILQDENITKEEIAAAYLTAFYQCGLTQKLLQTFYSYTTFLHV